MNITLNTQFTVSDDAKTVEKAILNVTLRSAHLCGLVLDKQKTLVWPAVEHSQKIQITLSGRIQLTVEQQQQTKIVSKQGYRFYSDQSNLKPTTLFIVDQIHKLSKECYFPANLNTISAEDINYIYDFIVFDFVEIWWVTSIFGIYDYSNNVIGCTFVYKYDEATILKYQKQIEQSIQQIISQKPNLKQLLPIQQEYFIQSAICKTISYNYEWLNNSKDVKDILAGKKPYDLNPESRLRLENPNNILGGFVGRQVVCSGYSCCFKRLCDEIGLESIMVYGYIHYPAPKEPELHAWNLIKLNGQWSHVDSTWNKLPTLTYFNLSCSAITKMMHQVDDHVQNVKVPSCPSMSLSYFATQGTLVSETDAGSIEDNIANCVVNSVQNSKQEEIDTVVFLDFKKKPSYSIDRILVRAAKKMNQIVESVNIWPPDDHTLHLTLKRGPKDPLFIYPEEQKPIERTIAERIAGHVASRNLVSDCQIYFEIIDAKIPEKVIVNDIVNFAACMASRDFRIQDLRYLSQRMALSLVFPKADSIKIFLPPEAFQDTFIRSLLNVVSGRKQGDSVKITMLLQEMPPPQLVLAHLVQMAAIRGGFLFETKENLYVQTRLEFSITVLSYAEFSIFVTSAATLDEYAKKIEAFCKNHKGKQKLFVVVASTGVELNEYEVVKKVNANLSPDKIVVKVEKLNYTASYREVDLEVV